MLGFIKNSKSLIEVNPLNPVAFLFPILLFHLFHSNSRLYVEIYYVMRKRLWVGVGSATPRGSMIRSTYRELIEGDIVVQKV